MACALIKLSAVSGTVTNVIVADANKDYPPDKTSIMVNIPDGFPVAVGWTWDSVNGFALPAKDGSILDPINVTAVPVVDPSAAPATVDTTVMAVATVPVSTTTISTTAVSTATVQVST